MLRQTLNKKKKIDISLVKRCLHQHTMQQVLGDTFVSQAINEISLANVSRVLTL